MQAAVGSSEILPATPGQNAQPKTLAKGKLCFQELICTGSVGKNIYIVGVSMDQMGLMQESGGAVSPTLQELVACQPCFHPIPLA